jgi:hypothetical protein
MKCLSYSPQHRSKDLDDLRGLVQHSSSEQRDEAARLVRLIQQRGFSRQQDLAAKLSELYRQVA